MICGTTAKASTLDDTKHRELIHFAAKVFNKRVPLIAGTRSNNTHHGVLLSKYAEAVVAGALAKVIKYRDQQTNETTE